MKSFKDLRENKTPVAEASKSNMLCKECGDQFGKPTNEKCMYDAYDNLGENWVTKEMYEGLDITEISLDMLTKKISGDKGRDQFRKAMKTDKLKDDLAKMRARLDSKSGKPALAKEAVRRKGAPKMKGDFVAIQRAKDAELNKALGRTKTGRKKPERTMTSTQRSLAQLRGESVQSADKKPEKYVKPDGKVAFRMIRTDKNVVDKDA